MVLNEPGKAPEVKRACRLQEPKLILSVGGFRNRCKRYKWREMWSRQVDHEQSSIYLIGAINTRKSGVIEGAKHARRT